jgi:hypothetical protein
MRATWLLFTLMSTLAVQVSGECPAPTLPTTVEAVAHPQINGGPLLPAAWLYAQGIRIFDGQNCTDGKPNALSGGLVNVTGGLGVKSMKDVFLQGVGIYPDATGNGVFVLEELPVRGGKPVGALNITLNYDNVEFFDSPATDALSWARWSTFTAPDDAGDKLGYVRQCCLCSICCMSACS